ncbi:unnamed protein product, partial [Sphacelaria rigidula]
FGSAHVCDRRAPFLTLFLRLTCVFECSLRSYVCGLHSTLHFLFLFSSYFQPFPFLGTSPYSPEIHPSLPRHMPCNLEERVPRHPEDISPCLLRSSFCWCDVLRQPHCSVPTTSST